jgi:hypothetical protein
VRQALITSLLPEAEAAVIAWAVVAALAVTEPEPDFPSRLEPPTPLLLAQAEQVFQQEVLLEIRVVILPLALSLLLAVVAAERLVIRTD